MDFRAKDGIFHAFVRFFIGISSLTPYVCNSFSQEFIIKYLSKTESNCCLTKYYYIIMKNYGNYMNVYESMQLLHRAQVFFC